MGAQVCAGAAVGRWGPELGEGRQALWQGWDHLQNELINDFRGSWGRVHTAWQARASGTVLYA